MNKKKGASIKRFIVQTSFEKRKKKIDNLCTYCKISFIFLHFMQIYFDAITDFQIIRIVKEEVEKVYFIMKEEFEHLQKLTNKN